MTTIFNTPRGETYDPLHVELWTWEGERLGKVGDYEDLTFVWNEREADTADLVVPLDDLTATLLPCDGLVLVGLRYNGLTHLSVPVQAEARALDDEPGHAMLHVTTAGGWTLLDSEVVAPSLEDDPRESNAQHFTVTGALETVVKRIVSVASVPVGHPVVVLPDQQRGPTVTAAGAWDTPAEIIKDLIAHTDHRVKITGWLPGDPQPSEEFTLTRPCVLVDVVPYRDNQSLRWSTASGDISDWSVTRKRPSATRLVVANSVSEDEYDALHRIKRVAGVETPSPWNRREIYLKADTKQAERDGFVDPYVETELMDAAAAAELSKNGAAVEIDITVDSSALWEYGADGVTPSQYQIGDKAVVDLPVIGEVKQVVTSVEVSATPSELTVTPRVGTPDTLDTSIYAVAADTSRRITKIERRI